MNIDHASELRRVAGVYSKSIAVDCPDLPARAEAIKDGLRSIVESDVPDARLTLSRGDMTLVLAGFAAGASLALALLAEEAGE